VVQRALDHWSADAQKAQVQLNNSGAEFVDAEMDTQPLAV
jgi:hypothetical protein